jgi:hypothetical protein
MRDCFCGGVTVSDLSDLPNVPDGFIALPADRAFQGKCGRSIFSLLLAGRLCERHMTLRMRFPELGPELGHLELFKLRDRGRRASAPRPESARRT